MRGHSRELACSQIIGMGSSEAIEAPEWHKDINEEDAIGKFDEPLQLFLGAVRGLPREDWEHIRGELHTLAFFTQGPLLRALLCDRRCVLLIDVIDKVNQEFEALLLEILSECQNQRTEIRDGQGEEHSVCCADFQ